jgi:hypothetical protein
MKSTQLPVRRGVAPIATLLVLSPVIIEVLFGATRITLPFLLILQICIYCGAALVICTLVRRRRGWGAILLLGMAFAIAEECVILQTSESPPYQQLLFAGAPDPTYSWAFGVGWAYLLWALAAFFLIRHRSAGPAWHDAHRLALIFGALVASMGAGFVISGPTPSPVDLIGKVVLNVMAVLLLAYLAWKLHRRQVMQGAPGPEAGHSGMPRAG